MKEKAINSSSGKLWRGIAKNWQLYLMFLPVLAYFIIFHYVPMYGVQIAFKDFAGSLGIWDSPWVGFKHFTRFFNGSNCGTIIWNTVSISLYSLAVGFPVPILLAVMLNEVRGKLFKKTVQTVTYAPYFISMVVMAGMIMLFLSPSSGIINVARKAMGLEAINFMYESKYFKTIYVLTGVWQNAGWGSIIYLSALAGIDPARSEERRVGKEC